MTDIFLPGFLDKRIYFVQTNLKSVGTTTMCFLSDLCPVLLLFYNFPPSALVKNNLAGDFTD